MDWRIGCSGFQYKEWKDIFYPQGIPQTKWFEFYCTQFNCLELNSTFYSFPKVTTLLKWYDRSPADFVFSVKAPQTITHFKRFKECDELLDGFYQNLQEGLKEKLGVVLFQLPPSIIYSKEMLDNILKQLNRNFKNVIEFRHPSWWNAEVFKTLSDNEITFSGVSHPKMPSEIIHNHSVLYYRLHGVPVMFKSEYSKQVIQDLYQELELIKNVKEVYVLFNNTWGIAGVINARQLKGFLNISH